MAQRYQREYMPKSTSSETSKRISATSSEFSLMALLCMLPKTTTPQTAKMPTSSMLARLDLVAHIAPRIVNALGSASAHGNTSPRRKTNVEDVERELLNSEICDNFCAGNYCCSFLARYSRDSPPAKARRSRFCSLVWKGSLISASCS